MSGSILKVKDGKGLLTVLKMSKVFTVSKEEEKKIRAWMKEQDKKVAERQNNIGVFKGCANYGAIGGGYTYCFTPTGIGMIVKVVNGVTKEELDVTDYDSF